MVACVSINTELDPLGDRYHGTGRMRGYFRDIQGRFCYLEMLEVGINLDFAPDVLCWTSVGLDHSLNLRIGSVATQMGPSREETGKNTMSGLRATGHREGDNTPPPGPLCSR